MGDGYDDGRREGRFGQVGISWEGVGKRGVSNRGRKVGVWEMYERLCDGTLDH